LLFEGTATRRPLRERGTGLAEKLSGLDGFRVLEVLEEPDELVATIESTAVVTGGAGRGTRAVAHERMPIAVRDRACFGAHRISVGCERGESVP
jgi:hypothetical protein